MKIYYHITNKDLLIVPYKFPVSDLLCTTGDSTQHFIITYKGKESEKTKMTLLYT